MKLYEVPRNTRIVWEGMRLKFKHIDGMYSLCYKEDGEMFHLVAWADVTIEDEENAGIHDSGCGNNHELPKG